LRKDLEKECWTCFSSELAIQTDNSVFSEKFVWVGELVGKFDNRTFEREREHAYTKLCVGVIFLVSPTVIDWRILRE
jgi:hypothetical protein